MDLITTINQLNKVISETESLGLKSDETVSKLINANQNLLDRVKHLQTLVESKMSALNEQKPPQDLNERIPELRGKKNKFDNCLVQRLRKQCRS